MRVVRGWEGGNVREGGEEGKEGMWVWSRNGYRFQRGGMALWIGSSRRACMCFVSLFPKGF